MSISEFLPEVVAKIVRVKKVKLAKGEAVLEVVGKAIEFDVPLEILPAGVSEGVEFELDFLPAVEKNSEVAQRRMLQALIN